MAYWKKRIADVLQKHPEGLSIKDLAKKGNTTRHTVSVALAELKGENRIKIRKVAAAKLHYWLG
jgi:hypothetical protein